MILFSLSWLFHYLFTRFSPQIFDALALEDQKLCVYQLGWLNIFDPLQPDRQYLPLDLSVRDERVLVQLLAQLALQDGVSTRGICLNHDLIN